MLRLLFLILCCSMIAACSVPQTPALDQTPVELTSQPTILPEATSTATPVTAVIIVSTPTESPSPTVSPAPAHTASPTPTREPFSATPAPTQTATSVINIETQIRGTDGMTMVYVPEGGFTMGSPAGAGGDDEGPRHTVTLDGFWIDRTEVTNAQYRLFVETTGHRKPVACDSGQPTYTDETMQEHPVVCVSWDDAKAYCEWAGARLPTEAEWEKTARGTDERIYPWGISFDGSRANYCDTNCPRDSKDTGANDGYAQTAPVGSYPAGASPYGALDMAGNVWEWVSDWYNFFYYGKSPQANPKGPNIGELKVLRGGSWSGFITNQRSAFRAWLAPTGNDSAIGFRCLVPSRVSP